MFVDGLLLGASGIVFMMILLASMANIRGGEIPLTFIAVAVHLPRRRDHRAFASDDNVSQMAHLVGGVAGAAFGFIGARGEGQPAAAKIKDLGLAAARPTPAIAARSKPKT